MSDGKFAFGFGGFQVSDGVVADCESQEPPDACAGTISGEHCWERTGVQLLSNPPIDVERCKHCPLTRKLIATRRIYRYD